MAGGLEAVEERVPRGGRWRATAYYKVGTLTGTVVEEIHRQLSVRNDRHAQNEMSM